MKNLALSIVTILIGCTPSLSQTLWTGSKLVFEKPDSANWELPENQDRITESVWITRRNNQGIFNIKVEPSFDRNNRTSPAGTEWANGRISDGIENLTFTTWQQSKTGSSSEEVGKNKVLHLLVEDIYIDVKMLSWTPGGGGSGTGFGGGFSYERSTPNPTSINRSPAPEHIRVQVIGGVLRITAGLSVTHVELFTMQGQLIKSLYPRTKQPQYELRVTDVPAGVYLIRVNNTVKRTYFTGGNASR